MSNTHKKGTVSKHKLKAQITMHSMMIPALIFAIMFSIVPLFGLIIAFQDFEPSAGIFGSKFVDVYQFRKLFADPDFFQVLFNTVFIALLKIIAITVCSIIMALLINEVQNEKLKKIIQVTIFLPYFLSWALIGTTFVEMFSATGIVNIIIGSDVSWINQPEHFRGIIVLTDLWKNLGYQVVVFLAAITSINSNLYEAADIDGAGHFQKCWHITIPGIKPMIVLMCILNIGNIMNAGFEQILSMYSPLVYETGDILDTMSYRWGIKDGSYSLSTAVGLFKSAVSCIFFIISYRIAFKVADYKLF